MFGHQNNDQGGQRTINPLPPMEQPKDDAVSEPFNPALPSPGSSFGGDAPAPADPNPSDDQSTGNTETAPAATSNDSVVQSTPVVSDDLMDIKQQALSQLSPLVGHLDQTPEEKFRTTMMMIQASDNQDLVKDAYAAAQQITDEKAKAQALLDIVNEINYFTQHHQA